MALVDVTPDEYQRVNAAINENSGLSVKGVAELKPVEMQNNIVFDRQNNRMVGLPQGLTGDEARYVIDRHIDGVESFFGQKPINPNINSEELVDFMIKPAMAYQKYVLNPVKKAVMGDIPQAFLAYPKMMQETKGIGYDENLGAVAPAVRPISALKDATMLLADAVNGNGYFDKTIVTGAEKLLERNKKYIAQSGWEKPKDANWVEGFTYDLFNAAPTTSIGMAISMLTRSPEAALPFWAALTKTQAYQEARESGFAPDKADQYSTIQAAVNAGLEMIAADRFLKLFKETGIFKRIFKGVITEGVQEGTQGAFDEAIANIAGVRDNTLTQSTKSVLYQGALGAVTGGALGIIHTGKLEQHGIDNGLSPEEAKKAAAMAQKFGAMAQQNMAEFIEAELHPLAADDKKAMEVVTLMQSFAKGTLNVNEAAMSPETKEQFDMYMELFQSMTSGKDKVLEVEKKFYDMAVGAGLDETQARTSSQIVSARAEAASKAFGITPLQWYDSHGFELKVENQGSSLKTSGKTQKPAVKTQKAASRDADVLESIRQSLKAMRKAPPRQAKKLITNYIKEKGGIAPDSDLAGELRSMGITPQNTIGIFKKGGLRAIDNLPHGELLAKTGVVADAEGNYVSLQWLLDKLRDESHGIATKTDDGEVDYSEEYIRYVESLGLNPRTATAEEVYDAEQEQGRKPLPEDTVSQPQNNNYDDEILFQDAKAYDSNGEAKTDSTAFKEWFGDSKVVDTNDNPLVVYHGTPVIVQSDFAFDTKKIGQRGTSLGHGFYFTTDKATAQGYIGKDGGSLLEVYLSIKKPLDLNAKNFSVAQLKKILNRAVDLEIQNNKDEIIDYKDTFLSNFSDTYSLSRDKAISKTAQQLFDGNDTAVDQISELSNVLGNKITAPTAVRDILGYDGIKSEGYENKGGKEAGGTIYVAWFPTQIKSVNNQGTFDKNNPNIFMQGEKDARGSVTFGEGRTIINLFKGRDASTLLHELGHVFLRDMRTIAMASKSIAAKREYEAVKKWLGAKGWKLTRAQEEKFARGFEAYLREGKAPTPELIGAFEKFKQWLTSIYKSVKDLNVELSDEIRGVFDRMLGADYKEQEARMGSRQDRDIEADYERIANMPEEETLAKDAGEIVDSFAEGLGNWAAPVSTRFGNINEKLKHVVRRFAFDTALHTNEDSKTIKSFVEAMRKKMDEKDYRILDLALKNRDEQKVNEIVVKYGIEEDFQAVRDLLDKIYGEALDVGLDIGYLEAYFPRMVKHGMEAEYMAAMQGHEKWSEILTALRQADVDNTFTIEEKAQFVNQYLRGFNSAKIMMARPSWAKERGVDYVKPEFNRFYEDSSATLLKYISGMRHAIAARKMFGKSEKDTDKNIGSYVLGLVEQGIITPKQERQFKEMLKAFVEPQGTRGFATWAKNATYIYLMGSPASALTQIQDLAFSMYENGVFNTLSAFGSSVTNRNIFKKEDIGVGDIMEEFNDGSRSSKAVRKVFNLVGLSYVDNVGKETFIQAAYMKMQSQAKVNGKKFNQLLETVFGGGAEQVKKDIIDGNMTEDVKYLLFCKLSDYQPISLAEMPLNYLRGGNGRILYMLKTYTIKQFDVYRRELFDKIASGNAKETAEGLGNLIRLSMAMIIMGMGADALKDLIFGRKFELSDLFMDNVLKFMGTTKYQIYKSREMAIGDTFFNVLIHAVPQMAQDFFLPTPLSVAYDTMKDTAKIIEGKKTLADSRVVGGVPFFGKFYYWWWGGGRTQEDKKNVSKL